MVDIVEALVDGGRASAGPPLGPALGPKGVNTAQVIEKINEKTKAFEGMKVPIKVLINEDKSFDIKVGTPPMTALIKSELGLKSGSTATGTVNVANMSLEQAVKIAEMKQDDLLGASLAARVCEVAGTCVTMGVTVDGKEPRAFQAAVKAGTYEAQLSE
jgi:large subunit ribosomal protein L11